MRRLLKYLRRTGVFAGVVLATLVTAAMLGARPADPALWPPPAGVATRSISVVSHGYHTGLVFRVEDLREAASLNGLPGLMQAANRFAPFAWVEIGWGDAGFYRSAPTLGSVEFADALRALFLPGNASVLHIVGLENPVRQSFPASEILQTEISQDGFMRLAARLEASFAITPDGTAAVLGPGLYGQSLFFDAAGSFHLMNVCNHWVADLLGAAGLPVSPVLATYPTGLFFDLRWRAGLTASR